MDKQKSTVVDVSEYLAYLRTELKVLEWLWLALLVKFLKEIQLFHLNVSSLINS